MHAILHTIGSVVVVPYVALALFFLFVNRAAEVKGPKELIAFLWESTDRIFGWGIYLTPLLWLGLVATGFIPIFQKTGALSLCLLSILSALVIVTLSSNRIELGSILFLLPCVTVAAMSAWLFYRSYLSVK
ncbi:MAG: hypothetical protein KDB22_08510 [Planctomycetales bacterium]|nr:hypothetical protein [Planctomycetales bacterium]